MLNEKTINNRNISPFSAKLNNPPTNEKVSLKKINCSIENIGKDTPKIKNTTESKNKILFINPFSKTT
jgi:hypothetical protein